MKEYIIKGLRSISFLILVFSFFFAFLFAICLIKNISFSDVLVFYFNSCLTTQGGLLLSLQKSVPLIIATIGVIIAFKSSMWNVGAEGQIALGVLATAGASLYLPIPGILRIIVALILSFVVGAFWASIASTLKIKWGVPEMPITLMLSFIAIAIFDYVIANPWQAGTGYARTETIPELARIPFLSFPLSWTFVFSILLIPIVYWLIKKSTLGYKIRMVGLNARAASYAGTNPNKIMFIAMFLSGGVCAIAGSFIILGDQFFAVRDITAGYGFYALPAAIIAKLRPELVPFSSFLIAMIVVGSSALVIKGVPGQFAYLILGIMFMAGLLENLIGKRLSK